MEFHKTCSFDLLREDLINCYNAACIEGKMSISQRRVTITRVPKEGSNLSVLFSSTIPLVYCMPPPASWRICKIKKNTN